MKIRWVLFACFVAVSMTACHIVPHKSMVNTALINGGTIYGKVTYQGKPVENVVLDILEYNCFGLSIRKTISNKAGDYRFDTLPANIPLKLGINNFSNMSFFLEKGEYKQGILSRYEITCGVKKKGFLLPKGRTLLRQDIALKKK